MNYKYFMNDPSKWLASSQFFNNLHSLSLQRYLRKYLRVLTFIKDDIL